MIVYFEVCRNKNICKYYELNGNFDEFISSKTYKFFYIADGFIEFSDLITLEHESNDGFCFTLEYLLNFTFFYSSWISLDILINNVFETISEGFYKAVIKIVVSRRFTMMFKLQSLRKQLKTIS